MPADRKLVPRPSMSVNSRQRKTVKSVEAMCGSSKYLFGWQWSWSIDEHLQSSLSFARLFLRHAIEDLCRSKRAWPCVTPYRYTTLGRPHASLAVSGKSSSAAAVMKCGSPRASMPLSTNGMLIDRTLSRTRRRGWNFSTKNVCSAVTAKEKRCCVAASPCKIHQKIDVRRCQFCASRMARSRWRGTAPLKRAKRRVSSTAA
mmetsp:Transcript_23501/g.79378  ORF Transcript_23501/g.79378 Transcript_23501/m.79378 type:complete len:202 (+) Transcript_23501:511-1116(+)